MLPPPSTDTSNPDSAKAGWCLSIVGCFTIVYFTSLVVFAGVSFAREFIGRCSVHSASVSSTDFLSSCAAWDGQWYVQIVDRGYQYRPDTMSNVAFFPAYPSLGALVKYASGCRTEMALLVVSNACLLAAAIVMHRYAANRFPLGSTDIHYLPLLVCCLFPTTCFFRMAYTESLFLLCAIAVFYGIERRWNLFWIGLIVGFATSVRVVGIALLAPVFYVAWNERKAWSSLAVQLVWLLPLCLWGLIAFMVFQWIYLDDPLCFLKAQKHWEFQSVPNLWEKCTDLVMLKPIWGTYSSSEPVLYWGNYEPRNFPVINMMFWNPIYWMFAVFCLLVGYWKKVLNGKECAFGLALLFIPYYLQGPRAGMMSCGRYSAVVFPVYIALGHWLERMPRWFQPLWFVISAIGLFLYSGMFARWYWCF